MTPPKLLLTTWLALAACGCSAPPPLPVCHARLSADDPDFVLRQSLRFTHAEQTHTVDAVLQKRGETLTLVALAPWGGKAFSIVRTGAQVDFQRHVPADRLPVDPHRVLHDVDRALFCRVATSPTDGDVQRRDDDQTITERWEAGLLRARTFQPTHPDLNSRGVVRVDYHPGWAPDAAPPDMTLTNEWFGYRIELSTLDYRVLN